MHKLDAKDHALIRALKANSRASLVSLGRDIDLSRSATHDRITRLEELGVIRSYTAVIDESRLPMVRAFLTLKLTLGQDNTKIAAHIRKAPGISTAWCLSGDIDMILHCEAETITELGNLRERISQIPGIAEVTTRNIISE
jgi:DNA-binding Lrp family transcriptional regulator